MKEEIKQALENATPGRWHVQPGEYYDAVYSSQETTLTVVASRADSADAHLIANAPTWLKWQNERIERLEKALGEIRRLVPIMQDESESRNFTHYVGDMIMARCDEALEGSKP